MKIYLCGGMHDNWQDKVIQELNEHVCIDPRTSGLRDEKAYTEWDLAGIRACDVVLAYMDSGNPSGFGLNLEIGYAYALGKPIYFVQEPLGPREKYFGMARACASRRFVDLPTAIQAICDPR